jgi:hypothetical protein
LDNKIENLPNKNENIIFITEHQVDSVIIENISDKWIIFDHNISKDRYNNRKNIIPFFVHTHDMLNNKNFNPNDYRYYISHPRIYW